MIRSRRACCSEVGSLEEVSQARGRKLGSIRRADNILLVSRSKRQRERYVLVTIEFFHSFRLCVWRRISCIVIHPCQGRQIKDTQSLFEWIRGRIEYAPSDIVV